MKKKSEEYELIEEAQIRAFYSSCGISKKVADAALKIRLQRSRKTSPLKGKPKLRHSR
jgi:hypothetical protein